MYQPDEIDPETIKATVNAPLRENLEGIIQAARVRALMQKCYVTIMHEVKDGEEKIGILSHDPAFYERMPIQCPRMADIQYEIEFGKPRPFPTIVINPKGEVVVSKPSLCGGCANRLRQTVFGCQSIQFEPLSP